MVFKEERKKDLVVMHLRLFAKAGIVMKNKNKQKLKKKGQFLRSRSNKRGFVECQIC